jgi:TRAP-type C4-dicarboxylate transport system substrate-binding protein
MKNILLNGLLALALISPQFSFAEVVIRIATIAPKDSIWHAHLKDVDLRWRKASDNQVRLKIYAGTLGDEDDIMRRVRIGQLDAATISTGGLSSIDKRTMAMHIPLAFFSNEEMEYVRDGLAETLNSVIAEKGFKVLTWGEAGWVYFFTKEPVESPDDLRRQDLFVWQHGDSTSADDLWKKAGFNTVPLSSIDIMPALQTGMISAYTAPPLASLANQWFAFTPYMTDLKWAPLTGATIITNRAWKKIPDSLKEELAMIVVEEGKKLQQDVRALEQEALDAMVTRGLKVVPVSPPVKHQWQQKLLTTYPDIRGAIVPAEIFDEAIRLRDKYRSGNGPSYQ